VLVSKIARRIIMTKHVAQQWLEQHSSVEYRMTVYGDSEVLAKVPPMVRAFRNGNIKIAGVPANSQIGIRVGFDHVEIWTPHKDTIVALDKWFHARGLETTGVW
jgi:hypothetical protein